MAPVKACLRRTFIIVDVVIGILGIIWLALSLFLHGHYHGIKGGQNYESDAIAGFSSLYAFGVWVALMCAVGLYGILKKKQWALIVFSVGMILVCLVFLVTALSAVISSCMTEEYAKVALKPEKPLDEETEEIQAQYDSLQSMFHCCGFLNGTHDWGSIIPGSCQCPDTPEILEHCISLNVTSPERTEEINVYEQPCFPYLFHFHRMIYRIVAAFHFTILLCLVVGPVLSIVILCQMRRKTIAPPVAFTTHASDSKYTELR
ncbi:hypothetical protein AALO_G00224130 [Alosa alosa]|uniref:Tetraspanin n=1 Tax=Alosa alosa TaxID=278164 RepID=A0AAV6FYM1_9TELE|nr:tetraspanin-8-like [Alosa alosa]KAG5267655.1 hypothetical protein AALO_G00224130 [Alosa alosa]